MTDLSRADVEQALAQLRAAGRKASIRAVAAAITANTGRRSSFSTISRHLAEITAETVAETPPPPVLSQQFAGAIPEVWRAALEHARTAMASEIAEVEQRRQETLRQVQELQDLLDDAQSARDDAVAHVEAGTAREQALLSRIDALVASLDQVHASWRAQDAAATARIAALDGQLRAAMQAIERERQAAAAAHATAQAALERAAAAEAQLAVERGTVTQVRADLAQSEQRLAETRVYVATLTDAGRAADAERADLHRQLLSISAQVAAAEQQARDRGEERDHVAEKLTLSQMRAENYHARLEKVDAENAALRAEQGRLLDLVTGIFSVRPVALAPAAPPIQPGT